LSVRNEDRHENITLGSRRLLLRDVLGWSAGETARALGTSVASANSGLQRARATLAKAFPEGQSICAYSMNLPMSSRKR
jgi:hypothetical protein